MKQTIKKILLSLMFIISGLTSFAQTEGEPLMRQHNKIYVVVAVLAAIFAGIVIYLIMIEKRLTKLEKQNKGNNS